MTADATWSCCLALPLMGERAFCHHVVLPHLGNEKTEKRTGGARISALHGEVLDPIRVYRQTCIPGRLLTIIFTRPRLKKAHQQDAVATGIKFPSVPSWFNRLKENGGEPFVSSSGSRFEGQRGNWSPRRPRAAALHFLTRKPEACQSFPRKRNVFGVEDCFSSALLRPSQTPADVESLLSDHWPQLLAASDGPVFRAMILIDGHLDSKDLADRPLKLPPVEVIRRFRDASPMSNREQTFASGCRWISHQVSKTRLAAVVRCWGCDSDPAKLKGLLSVAEYFIALHIPAKIPPHFSAPTEIAMPCSSAPPTWLCHNPMWRTQTPTLQVHRRFIVDRFPRDKPSCIFDFRKRQLEKVALDPNLSKREVANDDSLSATLHAEYVFAQNLIGIWPSLGRTTDFTSSTSSLSVEEAHCSEMGTTLVDLPHGFIIPGGRFRELYYWDAYWTIRGLLYSGLVSTARGMILNFASLIRTLGFIPNGTRTYYLSRSQPPVFSLMLTAFFGFTGDLQLVRDTYLDVEREYFNWVDDCERQTSVTVEGEECHLQRYVGHQSTPRPEGWKEDMLVADFVRRKAHRSNCEDIEGACANVFRNIRATAESGWDFSSRYVPDDVDMAEGGVMPHLRTESILPVDLNSFLYHTELYLFHFGRICEQSDDDEFLARRRMTPAMLKQRAVKRRKAMLKVFWNSEVNWWFDFDTTQGRQSTRVTAAGVAALLMQLHFPVSNKQLCRRFGCERGSPEFGAAPCSCADSGAAECGLELKAHTLQLLATRFLVEKSGLWNTWGLSTTRLETGQQWDGSNCWPPLLQMAVEAIIILEDSTAVEAVKRMVDKHILSCMHAYKRMGALPEKSGSLLGGSCGGGGEYECQKGFSWSIAVALELLFLKRVSFSHTEMRRLQREFGSAAFCQFVDSSALT
ncbi:hypothetical protein Esti_002200 [Eimeria stiedai]